MVASLSAVIEVHYIYMRRSFFGIFDAWTWYKTRGLLGRGGGCIGVSLNHHRIRHTKLHIRLIKTNFQCLSVSKIVPRLVLRFSRNYFFMQSALLYVVKTPLTLSDQAEIFNTNTLKYSPEVKLAFLIFDDCIRIYRLLKVRNSVLIRTFRYFFLLKKEGIEIFEKAQN